MRNEMYLRNDTSSLHTLRRKVKRNRYSLFLWVYWVDKYNLKKVKKLKKLKGRKGEKIMKMRGGTDISQTGLTVTLNKSNSHVLRMKSSQKQWHKENLARNSDIKMIDTMLNYNDDNHAEWQNMKLKMAWSF